jgi:hypothetical protein
VGSGKAEGGKEQEVGKVRSWEGEKTESGSGNTSATGMEHSAKRKLIRKNCKPII